MIGPGGATQCIWPVGRTHFGKYRRSRRHERRDFVQGIRHMFGSASLRHATKHYFGSFIDGSLETLCGSADIALAAALVGEPR